ncbi:hypothetical protein [Kribbella sp. NPDC050470]|uniref:hypothetical protein n=1 Tax=unclassified Kribbella TaxID=2644121 RepID=UPI0037A31317
MRATPEGALVEFVDTYSRERTMWHTVFIVLHAASGVVAFGTGCAAVRRQPLFPYYFWSLALLDIFMVISVAVGWRDMSTTSQVVFSGLIVLGGYMMWRGIQASRTRPVDGGPPSGAYLEHLGFTLIALFEGFVIVAAIDLGAPAWLVVVLAVGGVVGGHLTIRNLKTRLTVPEAV